MKKPLTPREQEVADLLVDGDTWKQIATKLGINRGTVRHHVDRIHEKLGVRGRKSRSIVRHFLAGTSDGKSAGR